MATGNSWLYEKSAYSYDYVELNSNVLFDGNAATNGGGGGGIWQSGVAGTISIGR